jgi:dTDP-4-dehydrorhamnose 3,5-epimerase
MKKKLRGLKKITRQPLGDHRGFLARLFCIEDLVNAGWTKSIAQINHTLTEKTGTVRGMHYQHPPHTEMKLVSCIRGEVWDVAVDLRTGSPTFLQWHAEILSAKNHQALLIPEGFAHGFQTLTDNVELLYCHTSCYIPAADAGLNPNDPRLNIQWPLNVSQLSNKDAAQPMINPLFSGIT